MKQRMSISRRGFLKSAVLSTAAPLLLPACVTGRGSRPAPSERITLGCIGVGNQGINDMNNFLQEKRVQVVAVCDVNKRSESGYWAGRPGGREIAREMVESFYADHASTGSFKGVAEYHEYQDLLARDDIDAVLIALPDHWHALPVVAAAEAGKDIYGEKPLSLTIGEGRIMSDAVNKYNRVFQTGSQQRSEGRFRQACELVRNGYIGELQTVRCGLPKGTPDYSKNGDRVNPEPVPAGFDYNTWLGPAPEAPYRPACSHVNWRWVFDYSGGQVTDWGGHHPDIAQWGMDTEDTGPIEIRNARATYAEHPVYNTATEYHFECLYKNGVTLIVSSSERGGVTFQGTDGWVWVDRGKSEASNPKILEVEMGPNEVHLYRSANHMTNFVDCVYSRQAPIAPIETAHRSISIAHLGNIAMRLGRDLKWNPDKERFLNDNEANEFLHRPYRGPWSLKGLPKGGRSLAS